MPDQMQHAQEMHMTGLSMTGERGANGPKPAGINENIKAYEKMLDELERHHRWKWVLFHDRNHIDAFDTFDTAAHEAMQRFGRGPYLIRQVGAPVPRLPTSIPYRPVGTHSRN